MAGTRRRSRISDASASAPPQRAVSVSASVAGEGEVEVEGGGRDAPRADMVVDTVDTVEEGPSSRGSPAHRATKALCIRCKGPVGDFFNSFHKITGSYYLPALL